MILGTTYRLQINTSVHLKELDDEACQAFVSIMHNVSILYGVQILTYRIRWANIMMLVESRLDHFSIRDFLAADENDLGSGKTMLFDHLLHFSNICFTLSFSFSHLLTLNTQTLLLNCILTINLSLFFTLNCLLFQLLFTK